MGNNIKSKDKMSKRTELQKSLYNDKISELQGKEFRIN